jgi:tetratricopeptide (TPR) repeat protein
VTHAIGGQATARGLDRPRLSPYVGREELRDQLLSLLAPGHGLQVLGPAGVGKSRLVSETLAGRHTWVVAASSVRYPNARGLFAGVVRQAHGTGAPLLSRLDHGNATAGGADDLALARAVGRSLPGLPGACVVLEDLELLPDAELDAVSEAIAASQVPWVAVSRRLLSLPGSRHLQVPEIGDAAAEELARALLPGSDDAVINELVRQAAGNALAIEHGAALVGELGSSTLGAPDRPTEPARSMRAFISLRVAGLGELERRVLDIVAVLGDECERDVLRHLSGLPDDTLVAALEALAAKGLLRRHDERVGFAHGLVCQVVYEDQPAERRAQFHRAAAEWYAVLPVAKVLESQAYHLEQSLASGTADCEQVRRTVEAMVLFARSIAEERSVLCADVVGRAQTLVDEHPACAVDTLQLELARASVQQILGDHEAAMSAAQRALPLADERSDTRALAEAHLLVAAVLVERQEQSALEHLDAAGRAFTAIDDPAGLARVELKRSWMIQYDAGIAQQLEVMGRAFSIAMRSADVRLQAGVAQDLAMHHAFSTGRPEFETWAQHTLDVSRADDVSVLPKLDVARAGMLMFGLDVREGLGHARSALEQSRDLGLDFVHRNALVFALDLSLRDGRLDEAREVLAESREYAGRRPTPWHTLQFDLLEAELRQRTGDPETARELLHGVAEHPMAENRVLRRDLAEARAWVALHTGHFAEARANAQVAVVLDQEMGERCTPLRPRLIDLVAATVLQEPLPLSDISSLRQASRDTGLTTVAELAMRWIYVDELTRGWTVDLFGLNGADVAEADALDLEIAALSQARPELLLEAAEVWSALGTTVWPARALLWHSELTGTGHPEAEEMLRVLQAPEGLGEAFRAQVRGLRS